MMLRPQVATCAACQREGVLCCSACGRCAECGGWHTECPASDDSVTNPGGSYDLTVVPVLAAGRQPHRHFWTDDRGWVAWVAP